MILISIITDFNYSLYTQNLLNPKPNHKTKPENNKPVEVKPQHTKAFDAVRKAILDLIEGSQN